MLNKPIIYFRVDGNSEIGLGHVIRCTALCAMLNEDFDCRFIVKNPIPKLKDQILEVADRLISIGEHNSRDDEARMLLDKYFTNSPIVVLDGYGFTSEYQLKLKTQGCTIVCIDDIHDTHFYADVVINHSPNAVESDYCAEVYTQFCLGLKYALLREPFLKYSKLKTIKENGSTNCLLICLGGADPHNDTLNVMKSLQGSVFDQYYVVIGVGYKYEDELKLFIESSSLDVILLRNLTDKKMVAIMDLCSVAITTPSTVSIEYLSIGGNLYLLKIADNQDDLFNYLVENGIAKQFVLGQEIEPAMETYAPVYIDGLQGKRLLRIFVALSLEVIEAKEEHANLYFDWVNDTDVRTQSFHQSEIEWKDHIKWFLNQVESSLTKLYIILKSGIPIGQVRFEIDGQIAILSYSVDKSFRGKGLSEPLLRKGLAYFRSEVVDCKDIYAHVKKDNIPSVLTFRSLGGLESESQIRPRTYKYKL